MKISLHSIHTGREILTYEGDSVPRVGEHILLPFFVTEKGECIDGSTDCEVHNVGHWIENWPPPPLPFCVIKVGLKFPFDRSPAS